MIVATGLHESPLGRGEDLNWLLGESGFSADYAVVGELGGPALPVAHVGCATFEITIRREGMVTHELKTAAGTPNPNLVAARVIEAIRTRNEELASVDHEWVGPDTYFLGEVHGGDFYNRHPTRVPARRHPALGAGEHLRRGGGGVPGAARAHRGRVGLRDRPRPAHLARTPTGSTPSTGSSERSATRTRRSWARSCP